MADAEPESTEPKSTQSGAAKKNTTAWLCVILGFVVAIAVAGFALLDWWPFAGERGALYAGLVAAALLHGALAALTINLFWPKLKHGKTEKTVMGTLSRDNLPDSRSWKTWVSWGLVLAATGLFDYWIFSQLNL